MRVYIITAGAYSDYHICGVATTEEKAEMMRRYFCNGWQTARVTEWDTDNVENVVLRRVYHLAITREGVIHQEMEEWTSDGNYENQFGWDSYKKDCVWGSIVADNLEQAQKILTDKRAEMIAERFGLT